jgi:hypothetical protein
MTLPLFQKAEDSLKGAPDTFITMGLFIVAAVAVVVALRGSRLSKAIVLAWMVFP